MGWIDPVSSPSCGYCCSFAAYNVRVDFVDADITVFALGQSVVLVGSMLGLLYVATSDLRPPTALPWMIFLAASL